jgi:hypothetical protein
MNDTPLQSIALNPNLDPRHGRKSAAQRHHLLHCFIIQYQALLTDDATQQARHEVQLLT